MSKVYQLSEESFQNMDDCESRDTPDFLALVFDNSEYGRAYRNKHTSLKDSIIKLLGDYFNYFDHLGDCVSGLKFENSIFDEFIKSNFHADEHLDFEDDRVKNLIIDKAIEIYGDLKNDFYEDVRGVMKIFLGEQDSNQSWGDLYLRPVVILFSNVIGTYTSYDKAKAKKRELLSTPYIVENTLTITEIEVE